MTRRGAENQNQLVLVMYQTLPTYILLLEFVIPILQKERS